MKFQYSENGLKKARRYLKQYHPIYWRKVQFDDAYSVILTANDVYNIYRNRLW